MKNYLLGFFLILYLSAISQPPDSDNYYNPIQTAVPYMNICINARLGGFGEIGAVSSPFYQDAGIYQNPALHSKNSRYAGGNISYEPWMKNVNDETNLFEINGYYAFNSSNAIGYHFKTFLSPEIQFTDENGQILGTSKWVEYYHQFTYAHSFKNGISIGGGIKYIRSDPGLNQVGGIQVKPGNAIAIDLGFNFGKGLKLAEVFILNLNVGTNINNFSSKINYTDDKDEGNFIPTTFRIGILLNPEIKLPQDFTLSFDFAYQAEKLLVPTPPIYKNDDLGNRVIDKGMDPNISPFRAFYQSFYDAPYGFEEEVNEIIHKFGGELRADYKRIIYLAGRIGKFIEHDSKGGRNYLTWGTGLGIYGFTLDYKRIKGKSSFIDETWALTFGFRTTLTNPAFRF